MNCGSIISAHTLQRGRVLEKLSDDENHVLTFYPLETDADGLPLLHRVGWRKASTFSAFCDRHDSSTFAPLEKVPYAGTKEQIFLIAYRAMCWELYQKTRAARGYQTRRDLVDRGMPPFAQREIQEMLEAHNSGVALGIEDIRLAKITMDHQLAAGDYAKIRALEITMEGPLSVAATGAIMPGLSAAARTLRDTGRLERPMDMMAFGCDIKAEAVVVVFAYQDGDKEPAMFVDSLLAASRTDLPQIVGQFFFLHCENAYFSQQWWDSLSDANRSLVHELTMNMNPSWDPPGYNLGRRLMPWAETSRRVI